MSHDGVAVGIAALWLRAWMTWISLISVPAGLDSEGCPALSTWQIGSELLKGHTEEPGSAGFSAGAPRLVLGAVRKAPEKVML